MDDNTRAALDTETPVNPYSLPGALGTAAAHANTLWLLFLALLAYLGLAVAGVTHRDLLADDGIALPLLQTRVDLVGFFTVAPAILALAHIALVVQLAPLARQARAFDEAVRLLETTDLRTHPLRLNLDGFFLVQAIAGPERSRILGALLHGVGWLTLLVLPLALLVYMQIAMLPLHDAGVTAWQRGIVLADLVLVLLAGLFLLCPEPSFPRAVLRLVVGNPASLVVGLALVAGAAFVSLGATVPGSAEGDRPVLGLFPRSLIVATTGSGPGKDAAGGPRSLSLRGRDLRFARLDGVDLRAADLTGADLDGASLVGADLRDARLGCSNAAILQQQPERREQAGCASARGASFRAARLDNASLGGADLRGARFDDAALEGADLDRSRLAGATFERARLQRARLSASLEGASFVQASLQGASLAGARLAAADLTAAELQGASLVAAQLSGAMLRDAALDGADLAHARLHGADLRGARLHGASLAGAEVWRTAPPAADAVALADVANIVLKAPAKAELEALAAVVTSAGPLPTGERIAGLKGELTELASSPAWATSANGQGWVSLIRASEAAMAEGFSAHLADHLGQLACRTRFADGAVAHGVLRRALTAGFKGEPGPLHARLTAADCPAGKAVSPLAILDLGVAAAAARPRPPVEPAPAPSEPLQQ